MYCAHVPMQISSSWLTTGCAHSAIVVYVCAGELPASDERARLLCMVHHQPLLALIQRCLSERREDRLNASDIISELDP